MTSDALNEEDWDEPERDGRGRFRKGSSGNPYGRPRKQPGVPWTYERSFIEALAETVPVTGPDGTAQLLAMRDVIIKSLVRNAVKAKAKDQLAILERFAKLNVLTPTEEEQEPDEDAFTEEYRRLMEIVERNSIRPMCCQCEKPVYRGLGQLSVRGDFPLE